MNPINNQIGTDNNGSHIQNKAPEAFLELCGKTISVMDEINQTHHLCHDVLQVANNAIQSANQVSDLVARTKDMEIKSVESQLAYEKQMRSLEKRNYEELLQNEKLREKVERKTHGEQFSCGHFGIRLEDDKELCPSCHEATSETLSSEYEPLNSTKNNIQLPNLFRLLDFDANCPLRNKNLRDDKTISSNLALEEDVGVEELPSAWLKDLVAFNQSLTDDKEKEICASIQRKLNEYKKWDVYFLKFSFPDQTRFLEENCKKSSSDLFKEMVEIQVNDTIVLPLHAEKHLMVLEVKKMKIDNSFAITLFNTGAGINYHDPAIKDPEGRHTYAYPKRWEFSSTESMKKFIDTIHSLNGGQRILLSGKLKTVYFSPNKFYEQLEGTASQKQPSTSNSTGSLLPYKQQVRGSCSYDALRAWLRQECYGYGDQGRQWLRKFSIFQLQKKCMAADTFFENQKVASTSQSSEVPFKREKTILEEAKKTLLRRVSKEKTSWPTYHPV